MTSSSSSSLPSQRPIIPVILTIDIGSSSLRCAAYYYCDGDCDDDGRDDGIGSGSGRDSDRDDVYSSENENTTRSAVASPSAATTTTTGTMREIPGIRAAQCNIVPTIAEDGSGTILHLQTTTSSSQKESGAAGAATKKKEEDAASSSSSFLQSLFGGVGGFISGGTSRDNKESSSSSKKPSSTSSTSQSTSIFDRIDDCVSTVIQRLRAAPTEYYEIVAVGFASAVMHFVGCDIDGIPITSITYACDSSPVHDEVRALQRYALLYRV